MILKESIDIQQFLKDVLKCKGDVCYSTNEGDYLNLKSQLSQFIFLIIYPKQNNMLSGQITITNNEDQMIIAKYTDNITLDL